MSSIENIGPSPEPKDTYPDPPTWIGVTTRGNGRFYAFVTVKQDDDTTFREQLGIFPSARMAGIIHDARAVELYGEETERNFPSMPLLRLSQLAHQARSNETRPNERLTLGVDHQQTIGDIVDAFADEEVTTEQILARRMIDAAPVDVDAEVPVVIEVPVVEKKPRMRTLATQPSMRGMMIQGIAVILALIILIALILGLFVRFF